MSYLLVRYVRPLCWFSVTERGVCVPTMILFNNSKECVSFTQTLIHTCNIYALAYSSYSDVIQFHLTLSNSGCFLKQFFIHKVNMKLTMCGQLMAFSL